MMGAYLTDSVTFTATAVDEFGESTGTTTVTVLGRLSGPKERIIDDQGEAVAYRAALLVGTDITPALSMTVTVDAVSYRVVKVRELRALSRTIGWEVFLV